jgi:hypothetical protein
MEQLESAILAFLIAMKDDVMSKLDDLKADVADYHAKVAAKLQEVSDEIAALKAQPTGVSDGDLQSVIDMIDAAKAELMPKPVEPAPAPVEPTPAPAEAAPTEAPAEPAAQ